MKKAINQHELGAIGCVAVWAENHKEQCREQIQQKSLTVVSAETRDSSEVLRRDTDRRKNFSHLDGFHRSIPNVNRLTMPLKKPRERHPDD